MKINIHKYPSNLEIQVDTDNDYGVINHEVNNDYPLSYEDHVDAITDNIVNAFSVNYKDTRDLVEDNLMPYHVNQ